MLLYYQYAALLMSLCLVVRSSRENPMQGRIGNSRKPRLHAKVSGSDESSFGLFPVIVSLIFFFEMSFQVRNVLIK